MTVAVPITQLVPGKGYQTQAAIFVEAPPLVLLPQQTFAAGVTVGPVHELGRHRELSLLLKTTAKSGTNPTLDVTIQHSHDGVNDWQTVGTFAQKTDVGLVMGAVSPNGTTPPTITLTSTAQAQPANLRVECTNIGGGAARGAWIGRYSIDGGVTWVTFTSAATVAVVDPNGTDTGIVINIAAGNAAVDNYWTASTAGYERKRFAPCGRFVRAVAKVGGSSTPTLDASLAGEAV